MKNQPTVFFSYSRKDETTAAALEDALKKRGLSVWRDARSIIPGERFAQAIEAGIRGSRGVVVLVSPASAGSDWVTYEYAFAMGAGVPIVAVTMRGAEVPSPMQQFQVVAYKDARNVAKQIDAGLSNQSRAAGLKRATSPILVAKFQEVNGQPATLWDGRIPPIWIEIWLEQVPKQTKKVAFEIPDEGFRDRKWAVNRVRSTAAIVREFLTTDMNSYGDIELWARGFGRGQGNWSGSWRLYEALTRYYRSRPVSSEIRAALRQIRDN